MRLSTVLRDPFCGDIYEGLGETVPLDQAVDTLTKHFKDLQGFNIDIEGNHINIGFTPRYLDYEISKESPLTYGMVILVIF